MLRARTPHEIRVTELRRPVRMNQPQNLQRVVALPLAPVVRRPRTTGPQLGHLQATPTPATARETGGCYGASLRALTEPLTPLSLPRIVRQRRVGGMVKPPTEPGTRPSGPRIRQRHRPRPLRRHKPAQRPRRHLRQPATTAPHDADSSPYTPRMPRRCARGGPVSSLSPTGIRNATISRASSTCCARSSTSAGCARVSPSREFDSSPQRRPRP
jgi:hypothetical protein